MRLTAVAVVAEERGLSPPLSRRFHPSASPPREVCRSSRRVAPPEPTSTARVPQREQGERRLKTVLVKHLYGRSMFGTSTYTLPGVCVYDTYILRIF